MQGSLDYNVLRLMICIGINASADIKCLCKMTVTKTVGLSVGEVGKTTSLMTTLLVGINARPDILLPSKICIFITVWITNCYNIVIRNSFRYRKWRFMRK